MHMVILALRARHQISPRWLEVLENLFSFVCADMDAPYREDQNLHHGALHYICHLVSQQAIARQPGKCHLMQAYLNIEAP